MRSRLLPAGVLAALLLYAGIAVQAYRARSEPERFLSKPSHLPVALGPSPTALNDAAESRMQEALETLRDPSTATRRRLEGYRDLLGSARLLLEQSLRVQPGQARAISRLAAVRWELDPPLGEAEQVGGQLPETGQLSFWATGAKC